MFGINKDTEKQLKANIILIKREIHFHLYKKNINLAP